jgi:hypothetical protein
VTSATVAYLNALRRLQLGEEETNLEELERVAREVNARTVRVKEAPAPSRNARLHITKHARQRMSQRGMNVRDVRAIFVYGSEEPDRKHSGRTRHWISENALELIDGWLAKRLRKFMGDIVVIAAPEQEGHLPAVITVLPFGEGTR